MHVVEVLDHFQDSSGVYEQDLWPPASRFPIKLGQRIAWTGESGAGGPHMHFEIRRGDMAYHPQLAGLTRSQTALAQPERTNGSALPAAIADMPIEDLDLPQRAFNSLKRHGITKVGQLLQTPDDELLRMRNFGKKSLDEIKERLAARGLIEAPIRDESSLGTDEPIAEDEGDTDTDLETTETNETTTNDGDDGQER